MPVTIEDLRRKKERGEPVVMLTCYDFQTACIEDACGVDIVFVGDSVGTNVLGYESVEQVTMEDMVHHLRAVRRGVNEAFLLVEMPYRSYETPQAALSNARRFLREGADGVKLEGGREVVPQIKTLRDAGIEVCGHIGFTPQTAGPRGRVVGKTCEEARKLLEDAQALEEAGVALLVLELVPEELSLVIRRRLKAVVIGIGSGRGLDGEVQVVNDILGITPRLFRHTKRFASLREHATDGVKAFVESVRDRTFPEEKNVSHLPADVYERLASEGVLGGDGA